MPIRDDRIYPTPYTPPQSAETTTSAAGGRPLAQSVKSLAIGFVAGVAFWHMIGFWSFIAEIAFNHDPGSRRTAELVEVPASTAGAEPAAAAGEPATTAAGRDTVTDPIRAVAGAFDANCSALVLDRKSASVRAAPCTPSRLVLVDAGARGRQDLAVADLIERQLSERLGLSPSRIETGSIRATD
ncbi:MAG: hypothetical protein AB1749_14920 [Pseudomonadota bacterium]